MNEARPQRSGLGVRNSYSVRFHPRRLRGGAGLPAAVSGPLPAQWKADRLGKKGQPRDAEIKQDFWEAFDDPVLTGLELEATTNNPDLRAAFERVEQSRAVARISQGGPFSPGES